MAEKEEKRNVDEENEELNRNLSENEDQQSLTQNKNGINLQRVEIIPEKIEPDEDENWAPPVPTPEFEKEGEEFELKTNPKLGEDRALVRPDFESPEGDKKESEYRVFKWRWFILIVVVLLNCANTMSWICFAPVSNFTDQFYGNHAANILSGVYLLCAVPVAFFALYGAKRWGLRPAILIASWANGLGASLRLLSSLKVIPIEHRFWIAILGQCVAAAAYCRKSKISKFNKKKSKK